MKLFVCALALGSALLLAGSASARPFFRPGNFPAGEIVVPPEWAGIWSYTDTTYNCLGVVTGTSSGLDTLCAGVRYDYNGDPSISCTGSADANSYTQHCTGTGEIFPDCNYTIVVDTHGTRSGDSFYSVSTFQYTASGTGKGCDLFPAQCSQINTHSTRTGPAPSEYCATPAQPTSWGQVKSLYR